MIVTFESVMQAVKFIAEFESFPLDGDVIMAMGRTPDGCAGIVDKADCILSKAVELGYVETFHNELGAVGYRLTVEGERLYMAITYDGGSSRKKPPAADRRGRYSYLTVV